MTEWRNSLTWRDTVKYAVGVYGFLILSKGEMTGREFAKYIRNATIADKRTKVILSEVEKHILTIRSTHRGTYYKIA